MSGTGPPPADRDEASGWAAEQLTAFLSGVSGLGDAEAVLTTAIEQAAEALEAEVAAVLTDERIPVALGFPRGQLPEAEIRAAAESRDANVVFTGIGACTTLTVPFDSAQPGSRLLLARVGATCFDLEEHNLVRGMARILALSLRSVSVLATERELREESQRHAADNAELVDVLRERQALLERLTDILRAISSRVVPVPDVLSAVVTGVVEMLGADCGAIRVVDQEDPSRSQLIASTGLTPDTVEQIRYTGRRQGASGRAMRERRIVLVDDYPDDPASHPAVVGLGFGSTMAAPVVDEGEVVGSLTVSSRVRGRCWTESEKAIMQAFADHASLALTDARTVQALRTALDRAQHDAMHDPLTGLPNRSLLRDRLEQAMRRARRHRTRLALLFLDLDGFKRINDSLGHDAGDQLLVAVADRLRHAVRRADTIARLGGDEFALLAEDVKDEAEGEELARRVFDSLAAPIALDGREIKVTASIGIAFPQRRDQSARDLLRNADLAMYEAKSLGKQRHVTFRAGMFRQLVARLDVENALRRGLDNEEVVAYYQPIVDLSDGRVTRVEALARWHDPGRGVVEPAEFIPVAEATGLIVELGEQVLRHACRAAANWQPLARIGVNVNLSPGQLGPHLARRVLDILIETRLPASLLTLEITESLLSSDGPDALAAIDLLRAHGVGFAIDDFGTGYSSLSRLTQLPVDQLKIDRSFVSRLPGDQGSASVVSGIVALGRGLGLTVIGEGVETPGQRDLLRAYHCDEAQGYLFGRPVPEEALTALLRPAAAEPAIEPVPYARSRPVGNDTAREHSKAEPRVLP